MIKGMVNMGTGAFLLLEQDFSVVNNPTGLLESLMFFVLALV